MLHLCVCVVQVTSGMDLEGLGAQLHPHGGLVVDSKLRVGGIKRGVFAAGDCTGDMQFTHLAGAPPQQYNHGHRPAHPRIMRHRPTLTLAATAPHHSPPSLTYDCTSMHLLPSLATSLAGIQGGIAAVNAVLPGATILPLAPTGRFTREQVPATTFTTPELARVGCTEAEARAAKGDAKVRVAFRPMSRIDRAVCVDGPDAPGFIKIVYDARSTAILGATICGHSAGELGSEIAVAMAGGVKFKQLATLMHAYPTMSMALQVMASEVYYEKLEGTLKAAAPVLNCLKRLGL